MPNSVPISAKEESHRPRWPIASFSTSAARACCAASVASTIARASFVFIASPPVFLRAAPGFARQIYHQPQLCFLRLDADRVAQLGRGKAALRADGEPLERDEAACLVDPALEFRLVFERTYLGRNKPEHDRLVL